MKLIEGIQDAGGSIQDAIQKMINDMFQAELDDDQIEEIVNSLSLSDMLSLDKAYTDGDRETVRSIIGPLPQLEYSMGSSRQPASTASSRPAPGRAQQGQQQKKELGTQNTVQTNRNYSSGAQNAVTTTKVDQNDPDAVIQDDEPIEETAGEYLSPVALKKFMNSNGLFYSGDKRGLSIEYSSTDGRFYWINIQGQAWENHKGEEGDLQDGSLQASVESNTIPDDDFEDDEPELDVYSQAEYDRIHSESEFNEAVEESTNIVDMVEWLKRRAGIA